MPRTRTTWIPMLVAAGLMLTLAGCGRARQTAPAAEGAANVGAGGAAAGGGGGLDAAATAGGKPGAGSAPAKLRAPADAGPSGRTPLPSLDQAGLTHPTARRRVIKNANLSLEVTDLQAALGRAAEIANRNGGLVSNSYMSGGPGGGGSRQAGLTLRVPAAAFDRTVSALRDLGKVASEQVSTEDVTDQFIDLQARVVNLEEQERRLRAILARANTIDDILRVEAELARVRGDIDGIKGRLQFLADQTDFSTINVNLVETALAARTVSAPSWRGVWRRAGEAFVQVSNAVLVFAAGLVVFLAGLVPVLVALTAAAGAGWAVWRWIRRGRPRPPIDAGGPS